MTTEETNTLNRICELENYIEGFTQDEIERDTHCREEVTNAAAEIETLRNMLA